PAVLVLARALGITDADVHAVGVRFDARGAYAGFDADSPLARKGGKSAVLAGLRRAGERLAFVGDGATDLEAAGEAGPSGAFAGVERRPAVLARARVRVLEPDFRSLVPLLLSADEIATLAASAEHRELVATPRSRTTPPTA